MNLNMEHIIPDDLVLTWLNNSKNTSKVIPVTNVSKYIAKFFYAICHRLKLPKEVYFTALCILDKMLEKCKNDPEVNICIKSMVTMVHLSTKMSGTRRQFCLCKVLQVLNQIEDDCCSCTESEIILIEKHILTKINYELPIATTLQDLNNLIDVIVKPIVKDPELLHQLQCHSSRIHVLICMYSQELWSVLEEYYWENEIDYVEGLKSERLFIPAGVLLYTIICHKDKLEENYPIARNSVIKYTTIHSSNYKLLVTLICKFGKIISEEHQRLSEC